MSFSPPAIHRVSVLALPLLLGACGAFAPSSTTALVLDDGTRVQAGVLARSPLTQAVPGPVVHLPDDLPSDAVWTVDLTYFDDQDGDARPAADEVTHRLLGAGHGPDTVRLAPLHWVGRPVRPHLQCVLRREGRAFHAVAKIPVR